MKTRITLASALAGPLALALFISTASAAPLTRQLELGSRGADVSDLQTFLALDSTIYPQGLVTGYFGFLTKSAVSNFQARNGIDTVGRVGPITLAAINAQMGGSPTSDTTEGAGKVTYVDRPQPILTNISVSTTGNSATINWNSNMSATAKVWYSTTWPFRYLTAPSATNSAYGNSQSVTINNLQPNTTYYYVVESLDNQGNFSWSANGPSFKTQ